MFDFIIIKRARKILKIKIFPQAQSRWEKAIMVEINRLYPQYNTAYERRQQKAPISPVAFERRSGFDRRNEDRIKLDTTLTRDIFEVKNKVAQLQNNVAKKADNTTFTQNISKAAQNSVKIDQFIRTTDPNSKNNKLSSAKPEFKANSQAGALAGILGVALGGTLASTFMGVAGVGIAIGIGAYFGGKALRSAIVSHLKNK